MRVGLGWKELLKEPHDTIRGISDLEFVIETYQSGSFSPLVTRRLMPEQSYANITVIHCLNG